MSQGKQFFNIFNVKVGKTLGKPYKAFKLESKKENLLTTFSSTHKY